MRKWLARHLRRLAEWLDPMVPASVLEHARLVVATVDAERHTGSYKRVMAIKAMRATFPDVRRRDVALAIDLAVREVLP